MRFEKYMERRDRRMRENGAFIDEVVELARLLEEKFVHGSKRDSGRVNQPILRKLRDLIDTRLTERRKADKAYLTKCPTL